MAIIDGAISLFDTTFCPEREDLAKQLVKYGDRKIPVLFEQLAFDYGGKKVKMVFAPDGNTGYSGNWTINIAKDLKPNDHGTVTHESVHVTQDPGVFSLYFAQPQFQLLYEGVADYYRVTLSDDKQGDHFQDTKKVLKAEFSSADLYDCGPEFVAYLRHRSEDPDYIKHLNNALRTGNADTIETFLRETCGYNLAILTDSYTKFRPQRVRRPLRTSRFEYFTDMVPM
jgi:hypothetical protein